jgi:hypothetical protein
VSDAPVTVAIPFQLSITTLGVSPDLRAPLMSFEQLILAAFAGTPIDNIDTYVKAIADAQIPTRRE